MTPEQLTQTQAIVCDAMAGRKIKYVAIQTGISRNTLRRIVRNEGQANASTLINLARFLGVSIADVVGQ